MVRLTIVIPTLNEAEAIVPTLASLQSFRGQEIEIIVVDGGSMDDTLHLAGRSQTASRQHAEVAHRK